MNLFITYPEYGNFSNKAWIPGTPGSYDSLESLHDQLHGLLGSGGHMSVVSDLLSHHAVSAVALRVSHFLNGLGNNFVPVH